MTEGTHFLTKPKADPWGGRTLRFCGGTPQRGRQEKSNAQETPKQMPPGFWEGERKLGTWRQMPFGEEGEGKFKQFRSGLTTGNTGSVGRQHYERLGEQRKRKSLQRGDRIGGGRVLSY